MNFLTAQTRVNKEWQVSTGNPLGLQWSSSIVNADNQLISVGNTSVSGQGANVFLTKYNPNGTITWQQNYNSAGTNNDYGISLTNDSAGNTYVCGTTENASTGNNDILLLKYAPNGTLILGVTYDSPFHKNDIATALKVDAANNIFVAARSESSTNNQDFLTLKFNASGVEEWASRYDFLGLSETPIGLDLDNAGNILVAGASGSSFNNWDYVLLKYDSNGNQIGLVRNALQGIGFDLPSAVRRDNLGNIYITGRGSSDGINYDIKTVKITPSLVVAWTKTFDAYGGEDAANTLNVDNQGNVVIGGYISKPNNVKELKIIRYDQQGNETWDYEQSASDPTGNAEVKVLQIDAMGKIYFVSEEKGTNGTLDVLVSRIDSSGQSDWQKTIASTSNDRATNINIANDGGIYVSSIKESSINTYDVVKYTESESSNEAVVDSMENPLYMAHELIVKFKQNAINKNAIDNRAIEFGDLGYYITPQAKYQIDSTLNIFCGGYSCDIKVSKVFPQLLTSDSTTISRLGAVIKIPDFWTTLLFTLPNNLDIITIREKLKKISSIISYVEVNLIPEPLSSEEIPNEIAPPIGCNDALYASQQSLHQVSFPDAHINVEEAWDLVPTAGENWVKCGVFDTGVLWTHSDFGYDGTNASTSKVVDGWNFENSSKLQSTKQNTDVVIPKPNNSGIFLGHGTPVAGIIGARRNNLLGIAGIAGGSTENTGIALYSLRIFGGKLGEDLIAMSKIADAIMTSSLNTSPNKAYAYGLHLMNHSWRLKDLGSSTKDDIQTLGKAVRFANRANVTFIAGRGNDGTDNIVYPACFDDGWVISVGAIGWNGEQCKISNCKFGTSYGKKMDIMAPGGGINDYIYSTKADGLYGTFDGTSSAAPHVSGIVGLLMSYLNTSSPSPSNLAPEDCERIIELSATDLSTPNYDDNTGWGKVNAGAALKLVEKGYNKVVHFKSDASNSSQVVTLHKNNENLELPEPYTNAAGETFDEGGYTVNVHKVTTTVNHSIAANERIVASWERHSSSEPLQLNGINYNISSKNRLVPHEFIKITSCTSSSCTMEGYVYELNISGKISWWPFDPNKKNAQFEYTLLTTNKPPVSINQLNDDLSNKIKIKPNPFENRQIINVKTLGNENISIKLIDITGKIVKNIYEGISYESESTYESDLSSIANGMYIYQIIIGNKISYHKIIKQ